MQPEDKIKSKHLAEDCARTATDAFKEALDRVMATYKKGQDPEAASMVIKTAVESALADKIDSLPESDVRYLLHRLLSEAALKKMVEACGEAIGQQWGAI